MNNLNTYIIEKLHLNKDIKVVEYTLVGKLVMICTFSTNNDNGIEFSLSRVKEVTDDYVKLELDNYTYTKNPTWKGNNGGYQSAYAIYEKRTRNRHILLKNEAVEFMNKFIKFGDRCCYCGKRFKLNKREAETILKTFSLEK